MGTDTFSGVYSDVKIQLTKSSDELLELNQILAQRIHQFVGFIDKFYYPKRMNSIFREFYRHDFKEIVDELENQGIRTRTQDMIELINLFDYFKREIHSLQVKIDMKQDEIDYIIGSLYSDIRDDFRSISY